MASTNMRLDRKVAVITGASRGIGRAIARAFAIEGADLVLLDVAAEIDGAGYQMGTWRQLQTTVAMCRQHGAPATSMRLDVRDSSQARSVIDEVLDRYGCVDALVNNAGLVAPSGVLTHELADAEWQLMLDVDLTGTWRMLSLLVPGMMRRRSGSVINIASTAGTVGYRYFAAYVAAKHGVVGLTRAAALDYAPYNVRINAVCPGSVCDEQELEGHALQEIARRLGMKGDESHDAFHAEQPTGRAVAANDVAMACVWLASDESRDVTGSLVTIDGGFAAR